MSDVIPGMPARPDFIRVFPYKWLVSSWSKDNVYPLGFRYKIISAHDKEASTIEILTLIQSADGRETVMKRCELDLDHADDFIHLFINGLQEEYGITFEMQDFSGISSAEQFNSMAATSSWHTVRF